MPHDISFVVTQPGDGGSSVTLGAHRFTLMVYNYRLAFKPTTPLIFLKRLKERKNKDEDSSLRETIKGGLNILCLFLICLLLKALPCSNEPSLSTNLLWGSR